MIHNFDSLLSLPHVRDVLSALKKECIEARIVGGAVRDALLGRPIHDVDIAVDADPLRASAVLKAECHIIPTGLNHGTITAVYPHNVFQITSLRTDEEHFGRHATVAFGRSFEEDAARRDFTINAMYVDREGVLYDYFGGQEDLRMGIVRFIGDPSKRIQEDYLRILRYYRMQAYFGGEQWHQQSLKACEDLAAGLEALSRERVRYEFLKILEAPHAPLVVEKMVQCHILSHMHNESLPIQTHGEHLDFQVHKKDPGLRSLKVLPDLKALREYCARETALLPSILHRLYALYHSHSLKIITRSFVLTKKEQTQWHVLMDWFAHEYDLAWLLYKHGIGSVQRFLYLFEAITGQPSSEQLEALKSLQQTLDQTLEVGGFPLQAIDLQALGYEGKRLGDALKSSELYWCEKAFSPSKEDLLSFLKKHDSP